MDSGEPQFQDAQCPDFHSQVLPQGGREAELVCPLPVLGLIPEQ